MADIPRAAAVRGKTMRWTWTEGPTKGKTHEHHFHEDGTVDWNEVTGAASAAPPAGKPAGSGTLERVPYAAVEAGRDVYLVSYLAGSGFTLTVALNLMTHQINGFASGGKEWHFVRGTVEVMP
ncbi:MAG: hypothetical protein ABJD11_10795 [Gemmatimonadota bacterium]